VFWKISIAPFSLLVLSGSFQLPDCIFDGPRACSPDSGGPAAILANSHYADIEFLRDEPGGPESRKAEPRERFPVEIGHAPAGSAAEMLMPRQVRVESADPFGGAYAAHHALAFQGSQDAVDGRERHRRHPGAQPGKYRIRARMTSIRGQGPEDGQPLGRDPYAALAALHFELPAQPGDLAGFSHLGHPSLLQLITT
jgi:hypothetical protein